MAVTNEINESLNVIRETLGIDLDAIDKIITGTKITNASVYVMNGEKHIKYESPITNKDIIKCLPYLHFDRFFSTTVYNAEVNIDDNKFIIRRINEKGNNEYCGKEVNKLDHVIEEAKSTNIADWNLCSFFEHFKEKNIEYFYTKNSDFDSVKRESKYYKSGNCYCSMSHPMHSLSVIVRCMEDNLASERAVLIDFKGHKQLIINLKEKNMIINIEDIPNMNSRITIIREKDQYEFFLLNRKGIVDNNIMNII